MPLRAAIVLAGTALPAAAAFGQHAQPVEAARLEPAREVVELTIPADQRDAIFEASLNSFMGNMMAGILQAEPELQNAMADNAELRGVFGRFIERQRRLALVDLRDTTPELLTAFANAYARAFSAAELGEIAAFLRTPVGSKYARVSPALFGDPDVAAWQRHVTEIAQRRQQEELAKFLEELAPIIEKQESSARES